MNIHEVAIGPEDGIRLSSDRCMLDTPTVWHFTDGLYLRTAMI